MKDERPEVNFEPIFHIGLQGWGSGSLAVPLQGLAICQDVAIIVVSHQTHELFADHLRSQLEWFYLILQIANLSLRISSCHWWWICAAILAFWHLWILILTRFSLFSNLYKIRLDSKFAHFMWFLIWHTSLTLIWTSISQLLNLSHKTSHLAVATTISVQ